MNDDRLILHLDRTMAGLVEEVRGMRADFHAIAVQLARVDTENQAEKASRERLDSQMADLAALVRTSLEALETKAEAAQADAAKALDRQDQENRRSIGAAAGAGAGTGLLAQAAAWLIERLQ